MMRWTGALMALFLCSNAWSATCKILEFEDTRAGDIPVSGDQLAEQNITYTTSTSSSAFNSSTRYIRIICDAKAHFSIGASAQTATAANSYVAADTPEYFGVRGGWVVAFYDGSS